MTVGLDDATVENVLRSGLLHCPVIGCGERLAPWGWARGRVVRGAGRLRGVGIVGGVGSLSGVGRQHQRFVRGLGSVDSLEELEHSGVQRRVGSERGQHRYQRGLGRV